MGTLSRRRFLAFLPAIATLAALTPRRSGGSTNDASAAGARGRSGLPSGLGAHPDPRPDVDASRVLTAEQLSDAPHAIPIYDGVREIPQIADGIRCYCGCADLPGYRSLLTCYEEGGMAKYCEICQGQGRLAHRRWKEGQSLDQIRRATDARYGSGVDASASEHSPANR